MHADDEKARTTTERGEGGFTLIEIAFAIALMGILAIAGISVHGAFKERGLRAEADAAWQELSMAANLYRTDEGDWPPAYIHAKHIPYVIQPLGALEVNLAPADFHDLELSEREEMVGAPGVGGPAGAEKTGHLIMPDGGLCVWVEGLQSSYNDANCP